MGVSALLLAALAAASGAASYEEERKRSSQAEAYEEEVQAQEAQRRKNASKQANQQAEARRRRRVAEAQQIRSQIQANAAEAGVSVGGTFEAMMRQIQTDTEGNLGNIGTTLANEVRGIALNRTIFQSQEGDPWLEGLSGASRGASQGMAMGSALSKLGNKERK